jgi:hypothetical protein
MSKLTMRCWLHLLSQVDFIRRRLIGPDHVDLDRARDLDAEQAEIEEALNDAIQEEHGAAIERGLRGRHDR